MSTKIPYANLNARGESWSPTSGCSGAGCTAKCWSRALAHRFGRDFTPTFHRERLSDPLHWRKPRRVLVCFGGDLFDAAISDEQIGAVFGVMAACDRHTFLVLTKQAERMAQWFAEHGLRGCTRAGFDKTSDERVLTDRNPNTWPLPNVWIGCSVSTQADADERIPFLLQCPAAVRWLSAEPLLGEIDLITHHPTGCPRGWLTDPVARIGWVVTAPESGPGARECPLYALRNLRDDCRKVGVPFMHKDPTGFPPLDGSVWDQMPEVRRG